MKFDFDIFIKANADAFSKAMKEVSSALQEVKKESSGTFENIGRDMQRIVGPNMAMLSNSFQQVYYRGIAPLMTQISTGVGQVMTKILPIVESGLIAVTGLASTVLASIGGPVGLAVLAGIAVIGGMVFGAVKDLLSGIAGTIGDVIGGAIGFITDTVIPQAFEGLKTLASISFEAVKGIFEFVGHIGHAAMESLKNLELLQTGLATTINEVAKFTDATTGKELVGLDKFLASKGLAKNLIADFKQKSLGGLASPDDYANIFVGIEKLVAKASKTGDNAVKMGAKLSMAAAEMIKIFPQEYRGQVTMVISEIDQLFAGTIRSTSRLAQQLGMLGEEDRKRWKELLKSGEGVKTLIETLEFANIASQDLIGTFPQLENFFKKLIDLHLLRDVFNDIYDSLTAFGNRLRDVFYDTDAKQLTSTYWELVAVFKELLAAPYAEFTNLLETALNFTKANPEIFKNLGVLASTIMVKTLQLGIALIEVLSNNKDLINKALNGLIDLIKNIDIESFKSLFQMGIDFAKEILFLILGLSKAENLDKAFLPLIDALNLIKGTFEIIKLSIEGMGSILAEKIFGPIGILLSNPVVQKLLGDNISKQVTDFIQDRYKETQDAWVDIRQKGVEAYYSQRSGMSDPMEAGKRSGLFDPLTDKSKEFGKKHPLVYYESKGGKDPNKEFTRDDIYNTIRKFMDETGRKAKYELEGETDIKNKNKVHVSFSIRDLEGKESKPVEAEMTPKQFAELKKQLAYLENLAAKSKYNNYAADRAQNLMHTKTGN